MNPLMIELLLPLFGASLLLALVAVPLARLLARRVGLVDRPDGRRKMHETVVPVAGGLAILVTALLVLLVGAACFPVLGELFEGQQQLRGLLLGALVICAVGVADDAHGLRGRYKLVGQMVAIAIVLSYGVRVKAVGVFAWDFDLGWLSIPFTMFFLLGAINSLNLIDGMDGLLGVVGTITSLAIAVLAAMHNHWAEAAVAACLAGGLVGFLRYNLPPATIFLGDAGSMLIGLVIGVLAIRSCLKGPATVALATPAALLIIPILDTAAAILRRKLTGRSIYSTDRGHLHHCLLRTGMSRPRALLIVSSLCLVAVLGALASITYKNEALAVLSVLAVVAILIASGLFGSAELSLVWKSVGAFARSLGGSSVNGHHVEVRLQGSVDWRDVWAQLLDCAERLNLRELVLDVNAPAIHEGYHARWFRSQKVTGEEGELWSADLPLCAAGRPVGRITLSGNIDGEAMWRKVAAIAEIAQMIETILDPNNVRRAPIIPPVVAPVAAPKVASEPWLESATETRQPVHAD